MPPTEIAFSHLPPSGNAWRPSPGLKCDNCGQVAKHRCSGCPVTDPTYYCSQPCQRRDWHVHKLFCHSKRIYAKMRDIHMPDEAPSHDVEIQRIDDIVMASPIKLSIVLVYYIAEVPCDKRPVIMLGTDQPDQLSKAVTEGLSRLAKDYTKEEHNARVLLLQNTKYKDVSKKLIPFSDRPWEPEADYGDSTDVNGINIYPSDFEMICLATYDTHFGWQRTIRKARMDPWHSQVKTEDVTMAEEAEA